MEATPEELEFFEWILTERNRCYWEFDRNGQRIKMIRGWEKAETEYNRIIGILGLRGNSENDLKVSRVPYSIE